MSLDDSLRAELRAVHVPYDGFTADHMIDRAVNAPGRRPMRLGAPLATAAAVLAIAGGTAFALAGGGSGGSHHATTPAGTGPSQPAAYTTPSNAAPQHAPLPADLRARIEQCIQTQGSDSWTSSNDCANVESICEVAQALGDSPCTLIPKAVVCSAPTYMAAADGNLLPSPADKAALCPGVDDGPTKSDAPGTDMPTKSVAPGADMPTKSVAPTR